MTKHFDFNKLQSFKGSVLKNLKVPDTYRAYAATSKKVLKIYLRMHSDQIFLPDLVSAIKDAATVLKYLGMTKYSHKAPPELIDKLEEVETCNIKRYLEFKHNLVIQDGTEVAIEESRQRMEGKHCSVCRVQLHYPAFVVHRADDKILHTSNPVGVKCLRAIHGRLNAFLNCEQIASVLREIKEAMIAA